MLRTRIVGILNITPDSFSDGGAFLKPDAAIKAIGRYCEEGADVIDIGAESTRPGATPLTAEEEWQRLEPVLKALPRFASSQVLFSLDTRYAETASKALNYGIAWINDVSGFSDAAMIAAAKSSDCMLVVMHSLTVPADKSVVMPESADVVQQLIVFAQARIAALQAAEIAREHIIFDPGIGFGKTGAQSLAIIRGIEQFSVLGVPLMIGHSRKSFLSDFAGSSPAGRDDATLALSRYLAVHGVDYLRVHDVAGHKAMLAALKERSYVQ